MVTLYELYRRKFKPWKPFNYLPTKVIPDCIKVGDKIKGELISDGMDYIAGSCGLDCNINKGEIRYFKVIKKFEDGDLLLKMRSNYDTIYVKYLAWENDNLVRNPASLGASELLIKFYY